MRKYIFIVGVCSLFGMPVVGHAATNTTQETTFQQGTHMSDAFRPKKKKKRRHGSGGCEAYGKFHATSANQ